MKLYGIANCNSVKKARAWLAEHGRQAEFHDFKKQGVSAGLLEGWIARVGWEPLLNRRGTTWCRLPDATKAAIVDQAAAVRLMLEKPSVIKRPVLENDGEIHLGFDADSYQALLGKGA